MRILALLHALVLIASACATARSDFIMTFEDIPAGTSYSVGDRIQSNGFTLEVGGNPSTNTTTQIAPNGFPGEGHSLVSFADRQLIFQLNQPARNVSLLFLNLGGTSYLEINGQPSSLVAGLGQLHGTILGGVQIASNGVLSGELDLRGSINSLIVSGQEIRLDNISISVVPEPSGVLLVWAAVAFVMWRRVPRMSI